MTKSWKFAVHIHGLIYWAFLTYRNPRLPRNGRNGKMANYQISSILKTI